MGSPYDSLVGWGAADMICRLYIFCASGPSQETAALLHSWTSPTVARAKTVH